MGVDRSPNKGAEGGPATICPICKSDITVAEIFVASCQHEFHRKCIEAHNVQYANQLVGLQSVSHLIVQGYKLEVAQKVSSLQRVVINQQRMRDLPHQELIQIPVIMRRAS